jgi:hypothetical protein
MVAACSGTAIGQLEIVQPVQPHQAKGVEAWHQAGVAAGELLLQDQKVTVIDSQVMLETNNTSSSTARAKATAMPVGQPQHTISIN